MRVSKNIFFYEKGLFCREGKTCAEKLPLRKKTKSVQTHELFERILVLTFERLRPYQYSLSSS